MPKKHNLILYSLLSAVLLSASWFYGLTLLSFIAWVPLLLIEAYFSQNISIAKRKLKFIGLTYLTFLLWNLGVTWWVWNASAGGSLLAFIANSLLMTIVFVTFSNIRNKLNKSWGIWLLIPVWLAWEHLHTLWDLTWTWLSLGNVFAFKHNWVQWYEFTGVSGGSAWILAVNILFYRSVANNLFTYKKYIRPVVCILIPIGLSYIIRFTHQNTSALKTQNILIVQPNIDPYNEKFDTDFSLQFLKMMEQIKGKINDKTDYLVLPETFVTDQINEDLLEEEPGISIFKDSLLNRYPKLNIITGINSYKFYKEGEQPSATARKDERSGRYYDFYNTAMQINKNGIALYHKSKLVPGVERMPFPALFKPLENLAINMGGTMGSLGMQETRDVFKGNAGIGVAPVICYESVYGDYLSEYIRNGANFIFIITNDGWWGDTPGYKQHFNYGRLRAIETRRSIARSANTGISAFINEMGDVIEFTPWWETAELQSDLKPNDELTVFARFGDILSKTAVFMALCMLIFYWYLRFIKR